MNASVSGGERYPLEAARTVRGHVVDEAEAALATAVGSLEAAQAALAQARARLVAHEAASRRDAESIRRSEERGGTAAELARGEAFRARRQREVDALSRAVHAARTSQVAAETEVEAARERLAAASAEQEVVERHHDRFRGAEKSRLEARADAEAEDLAAARRHRSE